MTDIPIASDLSYQVLAKRRRTGELAPPLHQPDHRVQPARGSTREAILLEALTGEAEPLTLEAGRLIRRTE